MGLKFFSKNKDKNISKNPKIDIAEALNNKKLPKLNKVKKHKNVTVSLKLMPFFKTIRFVTILLFIIVFCVSMFGYVSFNTLDASLSGRADANMPPQVKEIKDEYTAIQNDYAKFKFEIFRNLFSKTNDKINESENEGWGKSSQTLFGTDYLKRMRDSTANIKDETEIDQSKIIAPQVIVAGVTRNNNTITMVVQFQGKLETWNFIKKNGEWTSTSIPFGYKLGNVVSNSVNEPPHFELILASNTDVKWKIPMSRGAVITAGSMRAPSPAGISEDVTVQTDIDKMRTGGSYIMISNNKGKNVRYIAELGQDQERNMGQNQQNLQQPAYIINNPGNIIVPANQQSQVAGIIPAEVVNILRGASGGMGNTVPATTLPASVPVMIPGQNVQTQR